MGFKLLGAWAQLEISSSFFLFFIIFLFKSKRIGLARANVIVDNTDTDDVDTDVVFRVNMVICQHDKCRRCVYCVLVCAKRAGARAEHVRCMGDFAGSLDSVWKPLLSTIFPLMYVVSYPTHTTHKQPSMCVWFERRIKKIDLLFFCFS